MSGIPGHNFAAFDAATEALRETGWNVVSPADIARENGIKEDTTCSPEVLENLQRQDLDALLGCKAIFMLKGWQDSAGANTEFQVAQWLGLELKYEDETPSVRAGQDPKGDAGSRKTPMWLLPPVALEQAAWVHKLGAKKYGPWNWRRSKVLASTYISAALRHLQTQWATGQDTDAESGLSHLAHVIACCNILLDAQHHDCLVDDRMKATGEGEPLHTDQGRDS